MHCAANAAWPWAVLKCVLYCIVYSAQRIHVSTLEFSHSMECYVEYIIVPLSSAVCIKCNIVYMNIDWHRQSFHIIMCFVVYYDKYSSLELCNIDAWNLFWFMYCIVLLSPMQSDCLTHGFFFNFHNDNKKLKLHKK